MYIREKKKWKEREKCNLDWPRNKKKRESMQEREREKVAERGGEERERESVCARVCV